MEVLFLRIQALQQQWEAEAARFLELQESNLRLVEEIVNDMQKFRQKTTDHTHPMRETSPQPGLK